MRVIHTSHWHPGQELHAFDRGMEHGDRPVSHGGEELKGGGFVMIASRTS